MTAHTPAGHQLGEGRLALLHGNAPGRVVDRRQRQLPVLPLGLGEARDDEGVVVDEGHATVLLQRRQRLGGALEGDDLGAELLGSLDRKSTRLNSSHYCASRMPSST